MSEAFTSAWPNALLYGAASGNNLINTQRNALNMQKEEQDVGSANNEVVARAGLPLLNMSEEEAARAYGPLRQHLQSQGYGKNLPEQYPGHAVTRQFVALGIPAEKQLEYGAGRTAASGAASGLGLGDSGAAGTTGGAAAPAAPSAPGAGATIGQRQNNPGNLTFAGQPNATPGQGNRFASFPDMPTGVAANADQLALYQTQHGINTVRGAVTRWVGDPKADLTSYIADIAKSLGVSPDAPIDLTNPDVQAKFIQAQFPHESAGGGYVLNPADVAKGVQMAAARRGQIVQPAPGTATAGATPAPYRVAGQMQPPPGGTPGAAPATVPRETQVRGADGVVRTVVQMVPATAAPARTESVEPETGLPVVSGPAAAPTATAAAAPAPTPAPVVAAQPAPAPAAPAAPQVPLAPTLPLLSSGLTAQQEKAAREALNAPGIKVADVDRITAHYQALAQQNRTYNEQAAQHNYERQRQAQGDVETRAQHAAAAQQRAEDLELKRKADARAEAEAKRAGLPVGYRLDDTGKAVRIDGLPPDPAVLEAQANAGKQAQRQFEQENTLRDEFQKLTGDFRIVQTSYENIRSAAKANDGAGDMSLLYNYVRLLDPTSVVRESEFAAAAASGSFGERVQGAVARVLNGARMPETLRQSFIREGKNLYDNQLRSHDTVADQYEELARSNGLEPRRVVTRFARPQGDDPALPQPKTEADVKAMPSGTVFVAPDGTRKVKP